VTPVTVPVAPGSARGKERLSATRSRLAAAVFGRHRATEGRLRAVLDAALDAVIGMDADDVITYWNPRAEAIFGWARSEALGKRVGDLIIPPRYREAHRRGLKHFMATGEGPVLNRRIELQGLRRDGTEFPVELSITALKEGETYSFSAFVADIGDRKRSEAELRRYADVVRNVQVGLNVWCLQDRADPRSFRLISTNPAAERALGVRSEDILGRRIEEAFPHMLGTDLPSQYRDVVLSGEGRDLGEVRQRFGEGAEEGVFSVKVFPLPGDCVGVAFENITEGKRVADELRESERRLSSMLANLDLVSLMLDRDARITHCNDYFLRLTGWAREEVLGRDWFELFVPPELRDTRGVFAALLADVPEAWHHENEILTRAGGRRRIRWNNSVLRSASGDVVGVASIGEDVTESKRTEDQLRQSQKMEAVGRLAGGVAHDFNNALGVILGYTELLMRQAAEGQKGKLEQILKATQRASGLTRQLLAFSRKQIVDPKVLDLNALSADLEKMLGRLIGEDIDLAIVPGADLGLVKADPGQLQQVVMNLCVNARDAMPDGGLLRIETANVEVGAGHFAGLEPMAAGRYVMLAISDTGGGMDEQILSKIFEPFFTTKEEGKGTGLGLAMVYGIVKQAGGYVWVSSEVGRGTTFTMCLPRIDEPQTEPEPEAPTPPRGSETILLVEDEAALRSITREILEEHGYRVLDASGPEEAIEIARHHETIHLLLTDVVMPVMNGRILAESLVAGRPGLRVLYMSGYTDDIIAHRGVLDSGTQLLEKPFTARALLGRVATILAEAGAQVNA
jgi:PAS domain S-box-containing protein